MSDHTAIPMHLDPTQRRMTGRAIHGNTPFDVPYMSEIDTNLWQGGCADGLVLPRFIEHVVSVYPWESYRQHGKVKSFLAVRMYDDEAQSFDQVDAIAAWVNRCREDGPTLVHCQAGLNRSSLVAAKALMLDGFYTADAAIARIRTKRSRACLCNAAFERWLRGGA